MNIKGCGMWTLYIISNDNQFREEGFNEKISTRIPQNSSQIPITIVNLNFLVGKNSIKLIEELLEFLVPGELS